MMENNFDEAASIRLGKDRNTSADVLRTIVGHSAKVDRLVAKHPNADATVLSALSGCLDIKTFQLLLLNPGTPIETIMTIASSLIFGRDRIRHDLEVAEVKRLLGHGGGEKKFTINPDILPPGLQRAYHLPYKTPIVCRKLLCDFFNRPANMTLAIQLAKNKNTTRDALHILIGIHTAVDRLIAKHPNAEVDELSESKDRITRKNVLLNPNVSSYTAAMLASEFPDEFMKLPIPILNDLIIERSECIFGIGQGRLFQILSHPKCPPLLLNWACKRGGYYEQLAVWKNPNAPVELLTEMMVTGYQQETNVLLAHPVKIHEFLTDLGFVDVPPNTYEELCRCRWLSDTSDGTGMLWDKLVPASGVAETVQGEMVRAMGWIKGDYYKNGWGNWHQQYDHSQFIATHLTNDNTFQPFTVSVLRADIRAMDLCGQRCMYEGDLEQTFLSSVNDMEEIFQRLNAAIVVWCERHPEPIPYSRKN